MPHQNRKQYPVGDFIIFLNSIVILFPFGSSLHWIVLLSALIEMEYTVEYPNQIYPMLFMASSLGLEAIDILGSDIEVVFVENFFWR